MAVGNKPTVYVPPPAPKVRTPTDKIADFAASLGMTAAESKADLKK
jgi:hypothetical protein